MDSLAQQLAKRKLEREAKRKKGGSKWKTKAEIAKEKELALAKPSPDEPRVSKKKKRKTDSGRSGSDASGEKGSLEETQLPAADVTRRLRQLKQPIMLFAETPFQREQRLFMLETMDPEDRELKFGLKNDFLHDMKDMKEVDDKQGLLTVGLIDKEDEEEMYDLEGLSGPSKDVLLFLRGLLKEWEAFLSERADSAKRTAQGRRQTAIFKQTRRYIKPLFDLLSQSALSPDILNALDIIVKNCIKREYSQANDAYIQLAIGNAPWPMGVTMVGIHERAGRSKIFDNNIAHVLNDETQRKYIQSVKRLMTFAQKKYPTDPSKSVG